MNVTIAGEILDLLRADGISSTPQDPEPYQSMDMAYFRVTGTDGKTYYIQVSERKHP